MRLLRRCDTGDFSLTQFGDEDIPPYAILSHTWGADTEEVTFEDLTNGTGKDKPGYVKIRFCGEQARLDNLHYFWVDTCCIDKRSSAELSEAINSMYRWYQDANVCYAYLADVPSNAKFSGSRWFTRGWTLQELIAPSKMIFFDEGWKELGTKENLRESVSNCTGIPGSVLSESDGVEKVSIAQRMSWGAKRKTTRLEDRAYCLMGIFGINMPLLYGEGERAFLRLQEEIMRISDDHSLFAWRSSDNRGGLLATSPASFIDSHKIIQSNPFDTSNSPLTVSSRGIHLEVRFIGRGRQGLGLAILHCKERGGEDKLIAIYVRDLFLTMEQFRRVQSEEFEWFDRRRFRMLQYPMRRICIQTGRLISKNPTNCHNIIPEEIYPDHTLTKLMNFGEPESLLRAAERGLEDVVWLLLTRSDVKVGLKDKDGRTALTYAVMGGHKTVVKMLLARSEVEADLKDKDGMTLLWWAARMEHEAIVEMLLKSGKVDADLNDNDSRTLLSWMAEEGREAVVNVLLNKGANLESKDKNGLTPLSWAAENGHEAVIKLLLNKGANLESKDKNGLTPLSWAVEKGHEAVIKLLLNKGANLESKDKNGLTPLSWAVERGHEAVIKLLLNKGANLESKDKNGQTPLSWAAKYGYKAVVKLLLDKGANLESKDKTGQTPLSWAAEKGREAVVNVLLNKGANLESKDKNGLTPLSWAAENRYEAVVKLLLDKGTDLHSEDEEYDQEQLLVAARYGHEALVKLLLGAGKAKVDSKDKNNWTLLSLAAKGGHLAVVERLLQEKAEVNAAAAAIYNGRTALQAAAGGGHLAVVERLLQEKAEVNAAAAAGYGGRTALQAAAGGGHLAVVERLLQAKAEVNAAASRRSGRTALQAAAEGGYKTIVACLREAGATK
jgi:ankyrin repeat protein